MSFGAGPKLMGRDQLGLCSFVGSSWDELRSGRVVRVGLRELGKLGKSVA